MRFLQPTLVLLTTAVVGMSMSMSTNTTNTSSLPLNSSDHQSIGRSRDALLYGTLNYGSAREIPTQQIVTYNYNPPATIVELFRALIKATRDWFSDLILQVLGITSAELIKQINTALLGLEALIDSAVLELQEIVDQVPTENQKTLRIIIDCILDGTLQLLEPVQEQLKQILLYLPETKSHSSSTEARDVVSDIIEALLGISLEELLTNINNLFLFLNHFLLETMTLLDEIAQEVPPEVASDIEAVINQLLFEAQHELLRPLLNSLGQLPIDKSAESEYLIYNLANLSKYKYFENIKTKCPSDAYRILIQS